MQRYIMKIMKQGIISYKVEGRMDDIDFWQMEPQGEEYYRLTDVNNKKYHEYWEWWKETVAILPEDKVDICIIYEPLYKEDFKDFLKSAEALNICVPLLTEWNDLEVRKFFREKMNIKDRTIIKYESLENKFIVDAAGVFLIGGLGDFQLKSVIGKKYISVQHFENKPKVIPLPEKEIDIKGSEENISEKSINRKLNSQGNSTNQNKSISVSERINSEDLQNYIEKITENQCKTIDLRR